MNENNIYRYTVLVFGTSPTNGKGGISTAIKNILLAFGEEKINATYYCTHDEKKRFKSFAPFLLSIIALITDRIHNKFSPQKTIAFLHVGPKASLIRKLILAELLKKIGVKVATQYHSPKFFEYLNSWPSRLILKRLSRTSEINIAISEYWAELFRAHSFPRVISIGNMAPSPSINTTQKYSKSEKEPLIVTMCRLEKGKSVDAVIMAAKFLPDNYKLLICGSGRQESALKALSENLELREKVSFLGWVDDQEKNRILSKSNVFCLPSEYESFGMGYIEAMSYGCPVIGRDIPTTRAIIKSNVLGALWCGRSNEELAELIISEIEKDTPQKNEARQAYFKENFHQSSVIKKLDNAFKEAINQ